MIEIFKTNVESSKHAAFLLTLLDSYLPGREINFDLDDCDNILRIKGEQFCSLEIIQLLAFNGFACEVLT